MANWTSGILTNRGRDLQLKVEAGEKLKMTRFKLGDGMETTAEAAGLNDLMGAKIAFGITGIERLGTLCKFTGVVTSTSVSAGFRAREWGLFAEDPDLGEILYMIALDDRPDYIAAQDAVLNSTITYALNVDISQASKIEPVIDPQGLVTTEILEKAAGLVKRNTGYSLNDKAFDIQLSAHPSWRLVCTKAGTTSGALLNLHGVKLGDTYTDGTAEWTVKDAYEAAVDAHNKASDAHADIRRILDDKAPIESPALTGIPTAPTANKGTSNHQIANTAFVANGLADKFDKTGGVINPTASDEGYTEGIRIATAPNNWSTFILGCKPNTYEGSQAKNGGWGFFRTPANELIIGNRDCMADSSTVVFGSDQKAYFKQMVYAPDFFAYARCYAQDAFVTTGDGGLYLKKWGGGWYMNEGIWMRAYGDKNIYTGGVMKAGGGFEGDLRGRADATNGIAILTGTIAHGGTIPLPNGYTESQCKWMVSVKFMNDFATGGDLQNFECAVDEHRKVSCTAEGFGDSANTIANYIIIGVK